NSDFWLWLVGGITWCGCGIGAFASARAIGLSADKSWILMLSAISVPACLSFVTASYVDNTVMAAVLCGIALVLYGLSQKKIGLLIIGCLSLSISTAIKLTNLPYMAVGIG